MIAEHGTKVVAFHVYELHKHKLQLLNLAVHPAWRRMGVGLQMLEKLKSKLSSHRRTRIVADVRETNLPSQLFFKAAGWEAVKFVRGFYDDTDEGAIVFKYAIDSKPITDEDDR